MSLNGTGKTDFSYDGAGKNNENSESRPSSSVSGGRRRSVASIPDSGKRYMPSAPVGNPVHKDKPNLLDRTIESRNNTLPEVSKPADVNVEDVKFEIESKEDAEFDEKALQEKMEKTVANKSLLSKLWGVIKSPKFLGGIGLLVVGFVMIAASTVTLALPGGFLLSAGLFSVGLSLASMGTGMLFLAFIGHDDSQNDPPVNYGDNSNPGSKSEETNSNKHEDSTRIPSGDPTGENELPSGRFRADPVTTEGETGGKFRVEPDSSDNDELQGEFRVDPEITDQRFKEMSEEQRDLVLDDVVDSMMKGVPKDGRLGLFKRDEFKKQIKTIGQRMLDEQMSSSDSTIGFEHEPMKYITPEVKKEVLESAKSLYDEQDGSNGEARLSRLSPSEVARLEREATQQVKEQQEVTLNTIRDLNFNNVPTFRKPEKKVEEKDGNPLFGLRNQEKSQIEDEEGGSTLGLSGGENGKDQDQKQNKPGDEFQVLQNIANLQKKLQDKKEELAQKVQINNTYSDEITRLKKEAE